MVSKEQIQSARTLIREGFLRGTGWALGATFGFFVVITLLGFILRLLGGLPVVGEWFAALIEVTNQALETRQALPR